MNGQLHPDAARIISASIGLPAMSELGLDEARRRFALGRDRFGSGPAVATTEDITIPRLGGPVRARVYRPGPRPAGLVVHLHGGGWVLGGIEDFDGFARALCLASGCTVVLPEYRLAPEHPFPAGLHDAGDIIRWAYESRAALAGAPDAALIVSGDSAGANLATVATMRLPRDMPVRLQVLYYPVTDCDFDTQSYRDHGESMPLKGRDIRWFFQLYANPSDWTDPAISPLRSKTLDLSPPTIVLTAEFDALLDEGRAYAERLRASGVQTRYRELPGLPHGFVRWHNICGPSRDEISRIGAEMNAACRGTPLN